jgi:hypothetical protein
MVAVIPEGRGGLKDHALVLAPLAKQALLWVPQDGLGPINETVRDYDDGDGWGGDPCTALRIA